FRSRMRLLGAEVLSVDAGSRTLKDAINEAMRDWVTNVSDTYYLLRSVLGPDRKRLLGAEVLSVDAGSRTLKDAINEAMRDWVTNVSDTYYLLGSVLGPHPYPLMVREFQSVIGKEARAQILELTGQLPDAIVACVGGGSNAMGIFDAFVED